MKTQNMSSKNLLGGKKVLFIGNSYTYYGKTVTAASQETDTSKMSDRFNDKGYFYNICLLNGANVDVTNWTWGGHMLNDIFGDFCAANRGHDGHNHFADLKSLCDMYFDYVVIQPGSGESIDLICSQIKYIRSVFCEVNPDVKFVYSVPHQYYLRRNENDNVIISSIDDVVNEYDLILADWGRIVGNIVSGESKVEGSALDYNKNTFVISKSAVDGHHENLIVGYITSQTIYSAITGSPAYGQDYSFCTDSQLNSHFDVDKFIDTYYIYDNISHEESGGKITGNGLTNFPEVFRSETDMRGIQKLIDQMLNK